VAADTLLCTLVLSFFHDGKTMGDHGLLNKNIETRSKQKMEPEKNIPHMAGVVCLEASRALPV
jgi:hypothetical protein